VSGLHPSLTFLGVEAHLMAPVVAILGMCGRIEAVAWGEFVVQ
jgi:hypothetical protein